MFDNKLKMVKELVIREYNKSQVIEAETVSRRDYESLLRNILEILK